MVVGQPKAPRLQCLFSRGRIFVCVFALLSTGGLYFVSQPGASHDYPSTSLVSKMREGAVESFFSLPTRLPDDRGRPTLPWWHRPSGERYRVSREVAIFIDRMRKNAVETAAANSEAGALGGGDERTDSGASSSDLRADNATAILETLGPCGVEFMRLMSPCPPQTGKDGSEGGAVELFTLISALDRLNLTVNGKYVSPTGDDGRYVTLDQSRDASLLRHMGTEGVGGSLSQFLLRQMRPDSSEGGFSQFPRLFPLHPAFQEQLSEWGALLAVADAMEGGRELRLDSSIKGSFGLIGGRPAPAWVGINPVDHSLPSSMLDSLHLNERDLVGDRNTVFFWSTHTNERMNNFRNSTPFLQPTGGNSPDILRLHLDFGQAIFGPEYTVELPRGTWSFNGAFLMHQEVFLEFSCYCRAFLAHLLNGYVTVMRRNTTDNEDGEELVRPEVYLGMDKQKDRAWGYLMTHLINYWSYNTGMRMVAIHSADGFLNQTKKNTGRLETLPPKTDVETGKVGNRLRSCRRILCSSIWDKGGSVMGQARCPHLYEGQESARRRYGRAGSSL